MTSHSTYPAQQLTPNIDEARRFLALLDSSAESFTFQTFADRKTQNGATLARVFHGTLNQHAQVLSRLNASGAGVFVTVNKTDNRGRKAENITAVRAIWHEDDIGAPLDFHCRPSMVIESSPGKRHRYWLCDGLSFEDHRGVEEFMDVIYSSDPNAKDLSRVLRLPGFMHMKGEPFRTRIIDANGRRYSRLEVISAFPPITPDKPSAKPSLQSRSSSNVGASDPLNDPYAKQALKLEAQKLSETPASGGEHGGRNAALNIAATKLGGFVPHRLDRTDVEIALYEACVANGLASEGEDAVWRTMHSGLEHGIKSPRLENMPQQADANSAQEIERLAALPPFEYDKVRNSAAAALGVRVSVLDGEVFKRRKENEAQSSSAEFLAPPEQWADPVNGDELVTAMSVAIRRHIVLPDFGVEAIALWILHAHAHDAAAISPLLAFESPEKRCGKTTAMSVVQELVPKALATSNITPASLFRTVEKYKPTLLIDEADTFLQNNEELRGILNSGHNRRSAHTIRCAEDTHEPTVFSTWAPKAIALIGELPDTLQDRAIAVRLRRKTSGDTIDRLRLDRVSEFSVLRSKAARWAADHIEELKSRDPSEPDGLNDRACDNWRPLLAIADEIGGPWPALARETAEALSGTDREAERDPSEGVQLLTDIRAIFEEQSETELDPTTLQFRLVEMPEGIWGNWRFGKSITPRGIAVLLKPFGIKSRRYNFRRYYLRADFEDAWGRYIPS